MQYLDDKLPTTPRTLESIHAEQENRLAELADFLSDAPFSQKAASRAVVK